MRIYFRIMLYWLVPELKGMPVEEADAILEAARQDSRKEIRKYSGWCLTVALLFPFLLFGIVFIRADLLAENYRPLAVGAFTLICSIASSALISCFYVLILKPAIRRLLRSAHT
ncbi:hypothetical protein [Herbaspirillum sp. alder98]|uniref:hypothetical protein n=1 Tax=Herbaspirillum sp. alder98 TaxID=2913096 RepID=UPI001CD84F95|nr:hypothetical protein [Herbaspirillum sp. alder98]MCA1324530.1 hypothetical protein [Herbaspirillum sp. alder98]